MRADTEVIDTTGFSPKDSTTAEKDIIDEYIVVVRTQQTSLLEIFHRAGFVDCYEFESMACPQQSPKKKKKKETNSDSEKSDEEEEIPTTYELWQEFLHSLTLHGFRFIFEKGPKIRRIVWLVILILAVFMLLLQSRKSIQKYFDRPITTTVQVEFLDEITFPAVSICNFNLFPYYLINGTIGEKVRKNGQMLLYELSVFIWYVYYSLQAVLQNSLSLRDQHPYSPSSFLDVSDSFS